METPKDKTEKPPLGNGLPPGANIPEWVMHLLTGLGTMGAEYMMFIKPMQEKLELQGRLIKEQNERIDELEEMMQIGGKRKRSRDSDAHEDEGDLFQIRRKPDHLTRYTKNSRINL